MNDKDKRLIVEAVGLCWHEPVVIYDNISESLRTYRCQNVSCKYHDVIKYDNGVMDTALINLDPLDPADLYEKIWPAFLKLPMEFEKFTAFLIRPFTALSMTILSRALIKLTTSPPDLAQALLEYFQEKDKG